MSWREICLGDAFRVKHGYAFKSQYFSDDGHYVVLTPGNFNEEGGFRVRPGKDRFYSGDIPEDFVLVEGDLIVAMTEQGPGLLGSSALVPEGGRYLHNQRLGLIQHLDEALLDKHFLYYLFNTRPVRGQISGSASGTKVRHTAPERIYRVKATVPEDVQEQKVIARTLAAYDELIENNQRRIQLLEQAARLLYKEWFVHLRFPGHEHVTITGGVPEGWERMKLSEIADITMGQSPKSIYYNEDGNGLPFHQGVTNFGVRFPSHQTYCTVQNRLAEPGDILFSVRAPVGRINITTDKIVIGRGLAAIRSKLGQQNLLFYALKSHFFKEDMMGGGAIFAAITKKDLHGVELIRAPDRIAEMFMEHVQPIDLQIENLQQTIDDLTQARDLLLPRLMNGEVVV
ncbi:MAG TPA: restriction endonuclease subunit S [Candidatus Heimdallarchaeota archaeon]|nr:restriction endonuclease subunit S [Candidatus Heimdallarchaeota archaeon]